MNMHIRELRNKSTEELQKLLTQRRARLLDVRFKILGGRVKNVKEMRGARKDLARIFTLFRERIKIS